MVIEVKRAPDYRRDHAILRRELATAFRDAGLFLIKDNVQNVKDRQTPDGRPQQENSNEKPGGKGKSFREKKRAKLGHDTPLVAEAELLIKQRAHTLHDADGVEISRTEVPTTLGVRARLPSRRIRILGFLRAKGFAHWEITQASRTFLLRRLKEGVRIAKATIRQTSGD